MLSSFNVVLQTARLAQRMNKALRSVGGESISLPLKIVSINKSCNTNGLSVGQVLVLELGRKTQVLHEYVHEYMSMYMSQIIRAKLREIRAVGHKTL